MTSKKLAIFDIDGTIFRSSLLIELINGLVEFGVFPGIARKEMEKEYLAWLDRKGSYENYINKVINIHLKYIKGCRLDAVEEVCREVARREKDRVYRFTRDLIKNLKSDGYLLVAISGSPAYIVSKFAKAAGFHEHFGSEYEIRNNIFGGKVTNTEIFLDKAFVLKKFLKRKKIAADFSQSVAVGDTESDISLLQLVGRPIAFNPNTNLAVHAHSSGWQIVVERKDVIYDITDFNFLNKEKTIK